METKMKFLPAMLLILLPLAALPQLKPTSYDSDGDGIPDSVDKCMLVPGKAEFQGCPYAPVITSYDRDGDGVPDADDACPDMFGLKSNHGCPDIAMIDNSGAGENTAMQTGLGNNAQLFTSTSSDKAQQLSDFKNNLVAIIAASGHLFAGINTGRVPDENDYSTALCLAGSDECYLDLTQHFYAAYGDYKDLGPALERYDALKQNLILALGENNWQSEETTNDGIKSFEMRSTGLHTSFSPRVRAFVQQTPEQLYRVYLRVDSK